MTQWRNLFKFFCVQRNLHFGRKGLSNSWIKFGINASGTSLKKDLSIEIACEPYQILLDSPLKSKNLTIWLALGGEGLSLAGWAGGILQ
jgi:hypothetical protein